MDVRDQIRQLLAAHPVVLFLQGTVTHPMSAASARAVEVLQRSGVPFHAVDVQQDPFLRAALPRYANWPELPQVYVQGDLIGGSDILVDLHESGALARLARDLDGAPV